MPVPPRIPEFDVFETLGVTRDDPPDVVKAAWRKRVKEHHPDAAGGSDAEIKRINVAYDWLRDPTLRRTYLLATETRQAYPSRWPPDTSTDTDVGFAWADPPREVAYDGPRADRIEALASRIATAGMAELVDLVHGYRPEMGWSLALAHGIETSGRRALGSAAVWQVRRSVRDRVETLTESDEVRAAYDDELVGQVVSDRLADLARGIVLLDVLTPDARTRVSAEWNALMGARAEPPGDEPGLGVRPSGLASVGESWSRAPEGIRWLVGLLAVGLGAGAASALLPSQDATVVVLLGLGSVAFVALSRRSRPPDPGSIDRDMDD